MVVIEIPENHNCAVLELRVFHDVEPPRRVAQVRLQRGSQQMNWYDVTGWMLQDTPAEAMLQKVDDSGEGTAFLVYGAEAGLRLRPAGSEENWTLESANQWGEPYLLLAEIQDARVMEAK
ncbi:MAG: hypothetical protein HYT88_03550 [Candidatus Omnitrophica bacterium]|nr:hypothetical protein [Candidatus Omnitrophota bacterium]MBI2174262.1 hypothetical protein [Candidatus Omnitrophota bacterium]